MTVAGNSAAVAERSGAITMAGVGVRVGVGDAVAVGVRVDLGIRGLGVAVGTASWRGAQAAAITNTTSRIEVFSVTTCKP